VADGNTLFVVTRKGIIHARWADIHVDTVNFVDGRLNSFCITMTIIAAAQHADREKKLKARCKKEMDAQRAKTQRAKEREKAAKAAKASPTKKTRKKRSPGLTDAARVKIAASPRTIVPPLAEPMMPAPVAAPSLAPAAPRGGRTRRMRINPILKMRW